ncbi:MAG: PAC2 family protein [Candidatus Thermoplasmatota archaeon]|nr:PAC2 family protein [Candidatus Thermoplasmatota archaeon]MCL5788932.1 PAC2 family protein [Candidatus Thermoplasmatota archaeon]
MYHADPQIVEIDKFTPNNPLVILGFVESTTLGLLTSSYIIEQLQLHQIAQIKSVHIPPVTVFVGGKMRTPFRIYGNKDGTLMVITCEVPIDDEGLYEISSVLVKWLEGINPSQIIVIDGIPAKGLLDKRTVYAAAEPALMKRLAGIGVESAGSAIISGIGGALMNESIGKKISSLSLMTETSIDIPDPGAVLSIVEVLNKGFGLKIGTDILEESVKKLHEQANDIIEKFNQIQKDKTQKSSEQSMFV